MKKAWSKICSRLLQFSGCAIFIEFIAQKLQLCPDCAIADTETVRRCLAFVFPDLRSDKTSFAVRIKHFIYLIYD